MARVDRVQPVTGIRKIVIAALRRLTGRLPVPATGTGPAGTTGQPARPRQAKQTRSATGTGQAKQTGRGRAERAASGHAGTGQGGSGRTASGATSSGHAPGRTTSGHTPTSRTTSGHTPDRAVPNRAPVRGSAPYGQHPPAGSRRLVYAPQLDGQADPGEIVWTWVPYEDDPSQGKDRPVLVISRDGDALYGLMLSSQSDRDGQRHWFALGPGSWDRESRPSWIRLDRVLPMTEDGIRREGAVLDRRRFEAVAHALRAGYGWT